MACTFDVILQRAELATYLQGLFDMPHQHDKIRRMISSAGFAEYAGMKSISADDLYRFAYALYGEIPEDTLYDKEEQYGEDSYEAMVGHLADEILEHCCRVVLDY